LGRQEFLHLLVTQLRNQDPLNPIDDREFIAQMAQLTSLEAMLGVAGQVQEMVAAQQQTHALEMVGREIEFTDPDGVTARGRVEGVRINGSAPVLVVGEYDVPIAAVQTVL
jgi:flagellar basal-body rod modification protein FlgD